MLLKVGIVSYWLICQTKNVHVLLIQFFLQTKCIIWIHSPLVCSLSSDIYAHLWMQFLNVPNYIIHRKGHGSIPCSRQLQKLPSGYYPCLWYYCNYILSEGGLEDFLSTLFYKWMQWNVAPKDCWMIEVGCMFTQAPWKLDNHPLSLLAVAGSPKVPVHSTS